MKKRERIESTNNLEEYPTKEDGKLIEKQKNQSLISAYPLFTGIYSIEFEI